MKLMLLSLIAENLESRKLKLSGIRRCMLETQSLFEIVKDWHRSKLQRPDNLVCEIHLVIGFGVQKILGGERAFSDVELYDGLAQSRVIRVERLLLLSLPYQRSWLFAIASRTVVGFESPQGETGSEPTSA